MKKKGDVARYFKASLRVNSTGLTDVNPKDRYSIARNKQLERRSISRNKTTNSLLFYNSTQVSLNFENSLCEDLVSSLNLKPICMKEKLRTKDIRKLIDQKTEKKKFGKRKIEIEEFETPQTRKKKKDYHRLNKTVQNPNRSTKLIKNIFENAKTLYSSHRRLVEFGKRKKKKKKRIDKYKRPKITKKLNIINKKQRKSIADLKRNLMKIQSPINRNSRSKIRRQASVEFKGKGKFGKKKKKKILENLGSVDEIVKEILVNLKFVDRDLSCLKRNWTMKFDQEEECLDVSKESQGNVLLHDEGVDLLNKLREKKRKKIVWRR